MERSLDLIRCLKYRGEAFDPLKYVVTTLKEKLSTYSAADAEETRIAVKAYGCEFDNYLTCKDGTELKAELDAHRREHVYYWNRECPTGLPFSEAIVEEILEDDEKYDRAVERLVPTLHDWLMRLRIRLPRECVVYHGLVGLRKRFENPYRYMSTTTELYTAINFAMNDDLTESTPDKSEFPVVLELRLPAGTMVFSTDICYCVQEENEITLAYEDELRVSVDYSDYEKRLTTEKFEVTRYVRDATNDAYVKTLATEERTFYKLPAVFNGQSTSA